MATTTMETRPSGFAATTAEDARIVLLNRIHWGAVFAGVFVALVTQLLLNMLGVGIGAATIDPATADNPTAAAFSISAAVWWTISGIIAAFLGGHTAGRLSGQPVRSTAAWHGLISWALGTLIVVALITSALGTIVGGSLRAASGAVQGIGSSATQMMLPAIQNGADPLAAIERQVRQATGGQDPAAIRDSAANAVRAALTGDPARADAARQQAAEILARSQNIPVDQAREQIGQYETQYRQAVDRAKERAAQAAEVASKAASRGALIAFVALVLGAVAAWFGGRHGAIDGRFPRDDR